MQSSTVNACRETNNKHSIDRNRQTSSDTFDEI